LKVASLTGFHAFSGCDSTGSLFKKRKLTYWKVLYSSDDKTLRAFASLGTSDAVSDVVASLFESFVCRVYHKETKFTTLAALRWWMFSTKQAVDEKLPPTQGAFLPALRRVNFQAMVWEKDNERQPKIPSAVGHGWITEDGILKSVTCDLPCAPESILKLVKYSCRKSRCTSSCKCRINGLPCTEMCACAADDNLCDNIPCDSEPTYSSEDSACKNE